jgi:CRP-like cAMP-binding protein
MVAFVSDLLIDTQNVLFELQAIGQSVSFQKSEFITRQYQKGDFLYLLVEGRLSVSFRKEDESDMVNLGALEEPNTPIGWSALEEPYRYPVDISVQSEHAKLLRFDRNILLEKIDSDHDFGIGFYQFLLNQTNILISQYLEHLAIIAPSWGLNGVHTETYEEVNPEAQDLIELLKKSPFFESFDDKALRKFAALLVRRDFRSGDIVAHQGEKKEGLYFMDHGWVDFFFESEQNKKILFRSISTPGFNVGWMGLTRSPNYATLIARRSTSLLYIEAKDLIDLLSDDKSLAMEFFRRLIWLFNHQIQGIRARFLKYRFDIEWVAVKTLIESNATRLGLYSDFHEIPHLLQQKHSQKRAFQLLHELHLRGNVHERHLASLALDNLQELTKEHLFYEKLKHVYQSVVELPKETPETQARRVCAESVIHAFKEVDYMISGWENLPDTGGHIFIYNHLQNHPYNTLPNNFQITLDSHFISSLISYKRYGDPGIRVVRIGKDMEFGHQDYYERFGYIDVYTGESETHHLSKELKEKARQSFYTKAEYFLKNGQNLIISPEGTSYETSRSPGEFKSGAFRLALNAQQEPLIVPIVMANFDHRVRFNQFRSKILKPFKMSDFVCDPTDKEGMRKFLITYQQIFREEVKELGQL